MSLLVGLNTGLTAIRAARAGIDTASHNIANASTEGYTRQRIEQQARIPFNSPEGPIGTGVEVERITRLRDQFLDLRARTTSADFARLDVTAQLLGRVEDQTGEPDNGITAELGRLWNTFEDLAIDPGDPAVRRQVLTQLDALTSKIQSVSNAWDQLAADTATRRDVAVGEVNDMLAQIAEINRQVANQDPRTVSNDLLDQRDLLIDRVAEITGARASAQPDGTVTVTLGTEDLVVGPNASTLAVSGTDITVNGTPVTASLNGELAGLQDFLTTALPAKQTELDTFVTSLVDALNAQHAAGYTDSGAAGGPLLSYSAGDPAGTISVAIGSTSELAVAGSLGAGGVPGELDGVNAQALADLRTAPPGGSGPTLDQQLNAMIVDLGAQVAAAERGAQAAGDLAVSASVARAGMHSVSLDEEMVDVVRYQRALEAASRVMTAIDEALETLVNRVGIVGR